MKFWSHMIAADKPKRVFALTMVISAVLISVSKSASTQEIAYPLTDSGVLTHPKYGVGVEMRVQPSSNIPNDRFFGDTIKQMVLPICNVYAPHVLPFVAENMDLEKPAFIAVRIQSGGFLNRYRLHMFEIAGNTCGKELD